jgi:hypothetical protein
MKRAFFVKDKISSLSSQHFNANILALREVMFFGHVVDYSWASIYMLVA